MFARLRAWSRDTTTWINAEPWRWGVLGVGLAVGAGAGVPAGEKTFDYTWRDAEFCDDCHVHDYANEAWKASVHGTLTTCHDCHRVPISHYPRNLWVTAFDPPQTRADIHAPHIPVVVCGQCHLADPGDEPLTGPMPDHIRSLVVKIDRSPMHRAHLDSPTHIPATYAGGTRSEEPRAIDCMDCHGSPTETAHRFEATTTTCLACHEGLSPGAHGPGNLPCMQCHITAFLEEK